MSASTENTAIENQKAPSLLSRIALIEVGLIEIGAVLVILTIFFTTLNYFNILQISAIFPQQFGWLPHQAQINQNTFYTKAPNSTNITTQQPEVLTTIDLLTLPGWAQNDSDVLIDTTRHTMQLNGSSFAAWSNFKTNGQFPLIKINHDFSVSTDLTITPRNNSPLHLTVMQIFSNNHNESKGNTLELSFLSGASVSAYLITPSQTYQHLSDAKLTNTHNLKLSFRNVENNIPETLTLEDGSQKIFSIKLPAKFFSPDNQLGIGFKLENSIESIKVTNLQFSGKIQKINLAQ